MCTQWLEDSLDRNRSPLISLALRDHASCSVCGKKCFSVDFNSWLRMGPKDRRSNGALTRDRDLNAGAGPLESVWEKMGTGLCINWQHQVVEEHGTYIAMCMACMQQFRQLMCYNACHSTAPIERRILYSVMAAQVADKLHAMVAHDASPIELLRADLTVYIHVYLSSKRWILIYALVHIVSL
jgi:hypothetical protein